MAGKRRSPRELDIWSKARKEGVECEEDDGWDQPEDGAQSEEGAGVDGGRIMCEDEGGPDLELY